MSLPVGSASPFRGFVVFSLCHFAVVVCVLLAYDSAGVEHCSVDLGYGVVVGRARVYGSAEYAGEGAGELVAFSVQVAVFEVLVGLPAFFQVVEDRLYFLFLHFAFPDCLPMWFFVHCAGSAGGVGHRLRSCSRVALAIVTPFCLLYHLRLATSIVHFQVLRLYA